jgi:hypothetical protein
MLELDPTKRISASDALLSNWLKDINDDTLRPIQYFKLIGFGKKK